MRRLEGRACQGWAVSKTTAKAQPPPPAPGSRNGVSPGTMKQEQPRIRARAPAPKALPPCRALLLCPPWVPTSSAPRLGTASPPLTSLMYPGAARRLSPSAHHHHGSFQVGASHPTRTSPLRDPQLPAERAGRELGLLSCSPQEPGHGEKPQLPPGCATNSLCHPAEAMWDTHLSGGVG